MTAAVDYLASIGRMAGGTGDRRALLDAGMAAVSDHEADSPVAFSAACKPCAVSVSTARRMSPPVVRHSPSNCRAPPKRRRHRLADRGVFAWAGHYYAIEPMKALGVLDRGGLVRIGFVHTTTEAEVDRVLEELQTISKG